MLADRAAADATVDDALVTLPAGQSATFRVRTSARDLEHALIRPPVLRTANDLQHTLERCWARAEIIVPAELAELHEKYSGEAGRALDRWVAGTGCLPLWIDGSWTVDGQVAFGAVALIIPVARRRWLRKRCSNCSRLTTRPAANRLR